MKAIFSECGKYRYTLERKWDENLPGATVIMFNPSVANAEEDDPTIKSLTRILKHNGYGSFTVYNMWAIISTDPEALKSMGVVEARGDNARYLRDILPDSTVIVAWGTMGHLGNSDTERFLRNAMCFGMNKNGSPKHPLYLSSKTLIAEYKPNRKYFCL